MLHYDAEGALAFVTINTGSSDLQFVVHGRDLAHMAQYEAYGCLRALDPDATADGDGGVESQRLGVFVWNNDADQLEPTALASLVGYTVPRPAENDRNGSDHLFGLRRLESLAKCVKVGHNAGVRARALYEKAAARSPLPIARPYPWSGCGRITSTRRCLCWLNWPSASGGENRNCRMQSSAVASGRLLPRCFGAVVCRCCWEVPISKVCLDCGP